MSDSSNEIKTLTPLYKKTSKGDIQEWRSSVVPLHLYTDKTESLPSIIENSVAIISHSGKLGGKLIRSIKWIVKGKNIGKANATTPYEQAVSEAESKFNKKLDSGYKTSPTKASLEVVLLPMLAHPYEKRKHNIVWSCCTQIKYDGCLHYSTLLSLEDGSTKTIGEIVENKLQVKVKSFNTATGLIEYKSILNWMKDLADEDSRYENNNEWYKITVDSGEILIVTGNHLIWMPELNCYRRVDEIMENDKVLIA